MPAAKMDTMPESEHLRRNRNLPSDGTAQMRQALGRLRKAALALSAIVVVGTAGYMILEGWGFLDALYMTVITISTVGYGEVNQLQTPTVLFTAIATYLGGITSSSSSGDRCSRCLGPVARRWLGCPLSPCW